MNTDLLKKLKACPPAIEWASTQPDYKTAWQNCERGDWMLWLTQVLNVDDRKLTFAKYLCSKQVQHLMEDQRSIDAMEASLRYVNGEIGRDELNKYAEAATSAAVAAYRAAASAASAVYAAVAAVAANYAATAASAAADADAADAIESTHADATDTYTYNAARRKSLKHSADICREILTEEVLTAYENLIEL